jgi:hypothetical protein
VHIWFSRVSSFGVDARNVDCDISLLEMDTRLFIAQTVNVSVYGLVTTGRPGHPFFLSLSFSHLQKRKNLLQQLHLLTSHAHPTTSPPNSSATTQYNITTSRISTLFSHSIHDPVFPSVYRPDSHTREHPSNPRIHTTPTLRNASSNAHTCIYTYTSSLPTHIHTHM